MVKAKLGYYSGVGGEEEDAIEDFGESFKTFLFYKLIGMMYQ